MTDPDATYCFILLREINKTKRQELYISLKCLPAGECDFLLLIYFQRAENGIMFCYINGKI